MSMTSLIEVKPNPNIPAFASGDTVKVSAKIVEGEKERTQLFQGVVIKVRHDAQGGNFTVRRIAYGVGVERTFPCRTTSTFSTSGEYSGKVRSTPMP